MSSGYDEIPHPSPPRPDTQPDRLAALATLFGMTPAPPARSRVLDLGCSDGGNLISTAAALPEAELVGVDLSPVQIEQGRAAVEAVGLTNVRLEVADLRALPDLGEFDYVISYGLLSWVPADVRQALLGAVRRHLAPQGVAYLSYNTQPGWHFLRALREMLLYRADPAGDPRARLARARGVMQFLTAFTPDDGIYGAFLRDEGRDVLEMSDASLRWDLLGDVQAPQYFHELAAQLEQHDLQYVSEADLAESLPRNLLSAEGLAALSALAPDLVGREQYLDFLVNRSFRRSLVCRRDVTLQRALSAERLANLHVASRALPADDAELCSPAPLEFRGPKGTLTTKHPLAKGALTFLTTVYPAWVPVRALAGEARAWMAQRGEAPAPGPHDAEIVGEHLLVAYTRGMLELHAAPAAFTRDVAERPRASPLARRRLEQGRPAVNLRHELVELQPRQAALLSLLDGSRNTAALLAALPDATPDSLQDDLRVLAQAALLMP